MSSDYTRLQGTIQRTINTGSLATSQQRSNFLTNVKSDIAALIEQTNILTDLLQNLVDESGEMTDNGISGLNLITDVEATSDSDALYYSSVLNRASTIKESFDVVLKKLNEMQDSIAILEEPLTTLADLDDVLATPPTSGQALVYNGADWEPSDISQKYILDVGMPPSANASEVYRGWVPASCALSSVKVRMQAVNTVGNYTLSIIRVSGGTTLLSTATFNLNTLVSATVTNISLGASLNFSANEEFRITCTSDNVGFTPTEDTRLQLTFDL